MSFRGFLTLGLLSLLASSGFLLLIFGFASLEQVQALGRNTYHEGGYRQLALVVTPTSYQLLRLGLAAIAGVSLCLLVGLSYFRASFNTGARYLGREFQNARAELRRTVRQLSNAEKLVGASLLALILAIRWWYLTDYVLGTDEVASYDYFVKPGPLTISCFYPIPNNHLLFNFTCWPLTFLTDNTRLVMRLPTYAAAAVGTVLGYVLLTRWAGFRVATLTTGLFSLLPLSLYYAAAGRGYFLQLTLLLLAFFAAVVVLQVPAYRRLGWVGFVAASVLGFYTIPTFLYPFISLEVGLLLGLAWQRRWVELGHFALAGGIIGVVTALLYLPVVCVSGWRQLVGNHYVAREPAAVFRPQYVRYVRVLADMLAGNGRVGLVAGSALIGLGPLICWLLPRRPKPVAALAWLLLSLPLLLIAAQQVFVPARVLLYVGFFGCLLGSLAFGYLLDRLRVPSRYQLLLGLLATTAYGGYQFQRQWGPHQDEVREEMQMQAAYAWLTHQGAEHILLAAPTYELFFRHYAQQQHRSLLLHTTPAANQIYGFAVQARGAYFLPTWVRPPLYKPVYKNDFVVIYGRQLN